MRLIDWLFVLRADRTNDDQFRARPERIAALHGREKQQKMIRRQAFVCHSCRTKLWSRLAGIATGARSLSATRTMSSTTTPPPPPPTAPKPILNIRQIRDNVDLHTQNCIARNYDSLAERPAKIAELSQEIWQLRLALNDPRKRLKEVEKRIAKAAAAAATAARSGGGQPSDNAEDVQSPRREAQQLKDDMSDVDRKMGEHTDHMHQLALSLPNLMSTETPPGHTPRLLRYINFDPENPPPYAQTKTDGQTSPRTRRSHVDIGASLRLLDFASSATSTGWGFYFLINDGALLEHALVHFALSVARRRGWTPVSPPSVVYSHVAEACGFQPRDHNNEQQIWAVERSARDAGKGRPQRVLAGTAEIPLAAMHAGREVSAQELPLKYVASSRCYRAEAGARGVDTKGLYRVHEFTKVELFGWADVLPRKGDGRQGESSWLSSSSSFPSTELLDELLSIQVEILSALNLPCRVLEMPSTDLGASAARKVDIEALFPSRIRETQQKHDHDNKTTPVKNLSLIESGWGEVTSASICTDYQSRRLGTRIKNRSSPFATPPPSSSSSSLDESKASEATEIIDTRFPHTVNGTAMAIPRIIAAILENGYDEKRDVVVVPEALRAFMGKDAIGGGHERRVIGKV